MNLTNLLNPIASLRRFRDRNKAPKTSAVAPFSDLNKDVLEGSMDRPSPLVLPEIQSLLPTVDSLLSLAGRPLTLHNFIGTTPPDQESHSRGRPFETPFATRMHVGVGIFAGKTNYIAAQFPDTFSADLVNEISNALEVEITPVANPHLTLIPPAKEITPQTTTQNVFKVLNHSTLTFKRAIISKNGGLLLVPEDTTSARELVKQLNAVATKQHLPHQERELHILLGRIPQNQVLDLSNPRIFHHQGSNPLFVFDVRLDHPLSLNLSLTEEGNLIAEQITPLLEELPASDRAGNKELESSTNRFKERVKNVDTIADRFIEKGHLTTRDYATLPYDYTQEGIAPYREDPIHFTPAMLNKARDEHLPLSYQMVPAAQISALEKHVGAGLITNTVEVEEVDSNGVITSIKMAVIDNPEVVVQAFTRDLQHVFKDFDDVVVQQVGSGVTGFSRNPNKPLKPCDTTRADIDLAVKSKQVLEYLDRTTGVANISVNHKVTLSNKYTVLSNSPKNAGTIGFAQTELGQRVAKLSETWSQLLAGQSAKECALDPIVDFKLNINPTLFADAATVLNQPGMRISSAKDRYRHSLLKSL